MSVQNEQCTVSAFHVQRYFFITIAIIITIVSTVVVAMFENLAIEYIITTFSSVNGTFYDNLWAPAVIEEFTVRIVPAAFTLILFILWFSTFRRTTICYKFDVDALEMGALMGLTMAIVEVYIKILNRGGDLTLLFWESTGYHPSMIAPVLLHIVNGVIVIGVTFRVLSKRDLVLRDYGTIFSAYIVAVLIHWMWNAFLIYEPWFRAFWLGVHP